MDIRGDRAKIERVDVFALLRICAKVLVVQEFIEFVVRAVFARTVKGDAIHSASVHKGDDVCNTDDQSEHVVCDDKLNEREELGESRHVRRAENHSIGHQNHDNVEKKQRSDGEKVKLVVASSNAIRNPN